jgi:hypothetical protein
VEIAFHEWNHCAMSVLHMVLSNIGMRIDLAGDAGGERA